jgi:hypothetical protein
MSLVYPIYNPNDAPAIHTVLATLILGGDPPRVDVTRVHDPGNGKRPWLDRPPYDGRLFVRGKCRAGVGDTTGFHVWYCCARYGRTIPVREWAMSVDDARAAGDASGSEHACTAHELATLQRFSHP